MKRASEEGGSAERKVQRAQTSVADVHGHGAGGEECIPILLITDIGRDVDDALALCVIRNYERAGRAKIVGIVCCGGVPGERARVLRGLMRMMDMPDEVPVALCTTVGQNAQARTCFLPSWAPLPEADVCIDARDSAHLILDLAKQHAGKLHVLCIAPLSPLAEALKLPGGVQAIREGLKAVWVQGQTKTEPANLLQPDTVAFNIREDPEAAEEVFAALRDHAPFTLLGKHAAYKVSLSKEHFTQMDGLGGAKGGGEGVLSECVLGALRNFQRSDPDLFFRIYKVPLEKQDAWQNNLPTWSHPYDALLALCMFEPSLFEAEAFGSTVHTTVGNTEESPGIPQVEALKMALVAAVRGGRFA